MQSSWAKAWRVVTPPQRHALGRLRAAAKALARDVPSASGRQSWRESTPSVGRDQTECTREVPTHGIQDESGTREKPSNQRLDPTWCQRRSTLDDRRLKEAAGRRHSSPAAPHPVHSSRWPHAARAHAVGHALCRAARTCSVTRPRRRASPRDPWQCSVGCPPKRVSRAAG
jgi:hypothetical protein